MIFNNGYPLNITGCNKNSCCKGNQCTICPPGERGPQGIQGEKGVAETILVVSTRTAEAGTTASVIDLTGGPDHELQFIIPKGEQGIDGEQGIQGEKGEKGEKGNTGEKGDKGEKGCKGEKGDTGEKGDKGNKGEQGCKGEKGDVGEKGDKGEKGDTGAMGPQGVMGPMGMPGSTGMKGDKGDTGAMGPQGIVGPMGPQGITGPQGPQGIQGPKGDSCNCCGCGGGVGERGPQGIQGPPGDCCDIPTVDAVKELFQDIALKQNEIFNTNEDNPEQAVVEILTCSDILKQTDKFTKEVLLSLNQDAYDFIRSASSNVITLPKIQNIFPICSIIAISAKAESEIAKFIKQMPLPSFSNESSCPKTKEMQKVINSLMDFGILNGYSLAIGSCDDIEIFKNITPLNISDNLFKFSSLNEDEEEVIVVVTIDKISKIWKENQ